MSDDAPNTDEKNQTPPLPTLTVPPAPPAPAPAAPVAVEDVPPVKEYDYENVERSGDPVGVVVPGDEGGLANLVVRSLGMGDSAVYEGDKVEQVKAKQAEAGLEPDGIVRGATWALILGKVQAGSMGQEVMILKQLLGLEWTSPLWDDSILGALADRDLYEADQPVLIDGNVWTALLAKS